LDLRNLSTFVIDVGANADKNTPLLAIKNNHPETECAVRMACTDYPHYAVEFVASADQDRENGNSSFHLAPFAFLRNANRSLAQEYSQNFS
jgi:hypothetical protein